MKDSDFLIDMVINELYQEIEKKDVQIFQLLQSKKDLLENLREVAQDKKNLIDEKMNKIQSSY